MVLKKTAIAIIVTMLSLSLNANEDLSTQTENNDNCERQYSKCLEKCDQEGTENPESCYDTCDIQLTDCESKLAAE
ncbi:MAG: hypothetical protein ACI81I_000290 [Arcobacteraceae bacterium]|jgi:hypothetical protein